jgi:uncharacterized protein (TIGR00369 family)
MDAKAKTTRDGLIALGGLEGMRAMIEGRLPGPAIAEALGFRLAEVADGYALFIGTPSPRVLNPMGIVHGGFALTLIDSCTGCAGHTTVPPGLGYTTTLETKVNFVRVIAPDVGEVRAEGRVVARGRTILTAEGRVTDAAGKLYAHGTSTLYVVKVGGEKNA